MPFVFLWTKMLFSCCWRFFLNSPTVRDWAEFSRPISDWGASFNLRPQVYGWGVLSCAPTVSCMWQCQLSVSIFILCLCLLAGPKPVVSKKLSNYCQVTHCSWCCDDYRALLCVHHILNVALSSATHAPLVGNKYEFTTNSGEKVDEMVEEKCLVFFSLKL